MFAEMARELIDTLPELQYIRYSQVRIEYLISNQAKKSAGGTVHGECEKIPAKYKWAIDADFTVTIFSPNCAHMTEEQLKILLFHELLHVGIEQNDESGEDYRIISHDLEDFKAIIDRYGTEWSGEK